MAFSSSSQSTAAFAAIEAARRARELNIDLIITDHHEPDVELPDAIAVINPKRHDCDYPDKNLAGVGVALKLVQALCRKRDRERMLPAFVKVAAIGTLADVVPLVGENRVIAKLGLDMLSQGPHRVGLRALLDVAGLTGKPIDGGHVAFLIAPRMNAAGRMASPDIAARLLLAADETMAAEALELARQLDGENVKRQAEESAILSDARKIVETDPSVGARSILVVAGDGWHRGVIGIVASKLVDTFHRPVIVISIDGDLAHGSCRSIRGFDVLAALEHTASHLTRFGGHKQAAGLTMPSANVSKFREAIADHADNLLGPDDLKPRLRIDGCLGFRDINGDFAGEMALLAPFGAGNPRPLFEAKGVEVVDGPRRLKEKHLKMALKQNGRIFRAIAWRAIEREQFISDNRTSLDLAFSLEHNRYQGDEYLELSVSDMRDGGAMLTWQRRARAAALVVVVGVVAAVFATTRRREDPPARRAGQPGRSRRGRGKLGRVPRTSQRRARNRHDSCEQAVVISRWQHASSRGHGHLGPSGENVRRDRRRGQSWRESDEPRYEGERPHEGQRGAVDVRWSRNWYSGHQRRWGSRRH